jgi:hypothetical protein
MCCGHIDPKDLEGSSIQQGFNRRTLFKRLKAISVMAIIGTSTIENAARSAEIKKIIDSNKVVFEFQCDDILYTFHYEGVEDKLRLSYFKSGDLVSTGTIAGSDSQLTIILNQGIKFLKVTFTKVPNESTQPNQIEVMIEVDRRNASFRIQVGDPLLALSVTTEITKIIGNTGFIDFSGLALSKGLQASNPTLAENLRTAWGAIIPQSLSPLLITWGQLLCCTIICPPPTPTHCPPEPGPDCVRVCGYIWSSVCGSVLSGTGAVAVGSESSIGCVLDELVCPHAQFKL